jgi:hypothetical protein
LRRPYQQDEATMLRTAGRQGAWRQRRTGGVAGGKGVGGFGEAGGGGESRGAEDRGATEDDGRGG